jgi:NADH-quinone oxidoreductase subunit G
MHAAFRCRLDRAVSTSSSPSTSSSTAAASAQAAEAPKALHVTVNGRAADLPPGSSLYDAVAKVGAFVPVLCKHPRLPNTPGSCRCVSNLGGGVLCVCELFVVNSFVACGLVAPFPSQ